MQKITNRNILSGNLILILFFLFATGIRAFSQDSLKFFGAKSSGFVYTGRIDFSNTELPKFWSPGVYITANFSGSRCELLINDEMLWGKSHNYISVVIDGGIPKRIKLKEKSNSLVVAENLKAGPHNILICKGTEAGIGFLQFVGLKTGNLLDPPLIPSRSIEFIGNSITCGTGSDVSEFPCGTGEWYDQHNAYMSYGPVSARMLNARWVQTSVSGIGLTHSCCNMDRIITDVIDRINLNDKHSETWDFKRYQPDVVSIMLGQNDGIVDSAFFCDAYISFISRLRTYYPHASIICVNSPMADEKLLAFMKKSINSVVEAEHKSGDPNVYGFFFSRRFHAGCGDHPSLAEHNEIAKELAAFIKQVKSW